MATIGNANITLASLLVASDPIGGNISLPLFTIGAGDTNHSDTSFTLPNITIEATLLTGLVVGTTINLPRINLTIEAGKLASILLPNLSVLGVGRSGISGNFNKSLPRLNITGVGTVHANGTFDISLPQFTLDTNLIVGVLGTLNTNLSSLTMYARGFRGENYNADITLPSFTLNNTGYHSLSGTVSKSLKMLVVEAYADSFTNRII